MLHDDSKPTPKKLIEAGRIVFGKGDAKKMKRRKKKKDKSSMTLGETFAEQFEIVRNRR